MTDRLAAAAAGTGTIVRETAGRAGQQGWPAAWAVSSLFLIPAVVLALVPFAASAAFLMPGGFPAASAEPPASSRNLSSGVWKTEGAPPSRPWIIAHRGVSMRAPENTFAAFDLAVQEGAGFIELDVRRSRDGRLVVIHDATVNRTSNGTGRVADLAWDELRRLDAGSWFGPVFAGQPIPLLEEVLDRYAVRIGLLVELKDPGLERELAGMLARRGLQDGSGKRVIVQSFDAESMRRLRKLLPGIPTGVLIGPDRKPVTDAELDRCAAFANFINPSLETVDPALVRRIHERGMGVLAWIVRRTREVAPLLEAGVDGIITDDPALVPEYRRRG